MGGFRDVSRASHPQTKRRMTASATMANAPATRARLAAV